MEMEGGEENRIIKYTYLTEHKCVPSIDEVFVQGVVIPIPIPNIMRCSFPWLKLDQHVFAIFTIVRAIFVGGRLRIAPHHRFIHSFYQALPPYIESLRERHKRHI